MKTLRCCRYVEEMGAWPFLPTHAEGTPSVPMKDNVPAVIYASVISLLAISVSSLLSTSNSTVRLPSLLTMTS